jgi:hypothetical protein
MTMMPEFQPFPKLARLSREMTITEKIDGTNASVFVQEDGQVFAASRTRWITPKDDNYGFAQWVEDHETSARARPGPSLRRVVGARHPAQLRPPRARFSLFNVAKWGAARPECCHVVPILYQGPFDTYDVSVALDELARSGSQAVLGWPKPEGVVIYHHASGQLFKKTIDKNDGHKGAGVMARAVTSTSSSSRARMVSSRSRRSR